MRPYQLRQSRSGFHRYKQGASRIPDGISRPRATDPRTDPSGEDPGGSTRKKYPAKPQVGLGAADWVSALLDWLAVLAMKYPLKGVLLIGL